MSPKPMIDITVMVDAEHQNDLAGVTRDLKRKGFVLTDSLNEIGVLRGRVPVDSLTEVSTVSGVAAVEENRTDYRTQLES